MAAIANPTAAFDTILDDLAKRIFQRLAEHLDTILHDDGICFTEQEAASLLKIEPRQLGDERREGKISCSKIRQGRIRYSKADLVEYLAGRRVER
ncbi:helix-turn-helix domain-containing protein [Lacunimicrobium album]